MKEHKTHYNRIVLSLILALLLGACRGQSAAAPTPDMAVIATSVAATLQAQAPSATPTSEFTATATATPTETATPTQTPTSTSTPTATRPPATNTPTVACNQASFIADVTIPDGMRVSKNETFTKIWRVRNSGSCTWSANYTVVFNSGSNLASTSSFKLGSEVKPGGTIDISITMTAPNSNGTVQSGWNLRSENGTNFGVGANGGVPFFAKVVVTDSALNSKYNFAANVCSATWFNNNGTLPCPGDTSGSKGYVRASTSAELEHGYEDELMLLLRPNHASNGYIEGIFTSYLVKTGDRFIGRVGCQANSKDCHLRFVVLYQDSNGNRHQIEDWTQFADGSTALINIDLNSLAGSTVRFILRVEVLNSDYADANGFWLLPAIQNP